MQAAAELAHEQQSTSPALVQLQQSLDYAMIQLCISLLDHALFDTIYDSIVVVFMAVLGIRDPGLSPIRVSHLAILYIIPYISLLLSR
jgi:hypothetical protein